MHSRQKINGVLIFVLRLDLGNLGLHFLDALTGGRTLEAFAFIRKPEDTKGDHQSNG